MRSHQLSSMSDSANSTDVIRGRPASPRRRRVGQNGSVETPWPVPRTFRAPAGADHTVADWAQRVGSVAAGQASEWGLRPDGDPLHGWMSVVWPVLDSDGRRLMLKVGRPGPTGIAEGRALAAWRGRGTVRLYRHDLQRNALLLERLDAHRSLEYQQGIDEACDVIATILAGIAGTAAPQDVPPLSDEIERLLVSIESNLRAAPDAAPANDVARASDTLTQLLDELPRLRLSLLHSDCHFLNVLHTLPGQGAGWKAIDPTPIAGIGEWELTPVLRNRWVDAVRSGDPDAALRRRVDRMSGIIGLDPSLVRACAQALAVDNLLWLLPRSPDHLFVAPYSVLSRWR